MATVEEEMRADEKRTTLNDLAPSIRVSAEAGHLHTALRETEIYLNVLRDLVSIEGLDRSVYRDGVASATVITNEYLGDALTRHDRLFLDRLVDDTMDAIEREDHELAELLVDLATFVPRSAADTPRGFVCAEATSVDIALNKLIESYDDIGTIIVREGESLDVACGVKERAFRAAADMAHGVDDEDLPDPPDLTLQPTF